MRMLGIDVWENQNSPLLLQEEILSLRHTLPVEKLSLEFHNTVSAARNCVYFLASVRCIR